MKSIIAVLGAAVLSVCSALGADDWSGYDPSAWTDITARGSDSERVIEVYSVDGIQVYGHFFKGEYRKGFSAGTTIYRAPLVVKLPVKVIWGFKGDKDKKTAILNEVNYEDGSLATGEGKVVTMQDGSFFLLNHQGAFKMFWFKERSMSVDEAVNGADGLDAGKPYLSKRPRSIEYVEATDEQKKQALRSLSDYVAGNARLKACLKGGGLSAETAWHVAADEKILLELYKEWVMNKALLPGWKKQKADIRWLDQIPYAAVVYVKTQSDKNYQLTLWYHLGAHYKTFMEPKVKEFNKVLELAQSIKDKESARAVFPDLKEAFLKMRRPWTQLVFPKDIGRRKLENVVYEDRLFGIIMQLERKGYLEGLE